MAVLILLPRPTRTRLIPSHLAPFPFKLLNRLSGQLILTVAIRRDGRIEDITVVKSSGNRVLDRAAGDIVRLAEPFPALPKTAEDPSLLYITRTWQFIAGQTSLN